MRIASAAGGLLTALAFVAPAIVCPNAAAVPEWAYDALGDLAAAGYVKLPDGLRQLDRPQFAHLVAVALTNLNDGRRLPDSSLSPLLPEQQPAPTIGGSEASSPKAKPEATATAGTPGLAPVAATTATVKPAAAPETAVSKPVETKEPKPAEKVTTAPEEKKPAAGIAETTAKPVSAPRPDAAKPAAPAPVVSSSSPAAGPSAPADSLAALRQEIARGEAQEKELAAQTAELRTRYQQALQELRRLTANLRQSEGPATDGAERQSALRQAKEHQTALVEELAGALSRAEKALNEERRHLDLSRMELARREEAGDRAEKTAVSEAATAAAPTETAPLTLYAADVPEVGPLVETPVKAATSSKDERLQKQAARLRAEFAKELEAEGFFDDEAAKKQAEATMPPRAVQTPRFKLDGAARFDAGQHNGPQSIGSRSRLRLRLYPDYNIDNNWHFLGMVELEKILHGKRGDKDGNPVLDRYYLEGFTGITLWDIGAFGSTMAEGNIYDSKFIGIRARVGDPVEYTFEAGETHPSHRAYNFKASYRTADRQLFEGGFYYFSPVYGGNSRHIYMLNYRRPIGVLDFGAMYLRGDGRGPADNGNGYILSLSWGKEDSWRPGAQMAYLKYYHQPASTYVEHTMNGMADYMHGFRGWGLGYSYTLAKDWMLNIEVDRLQDLMTHDYNNTVWGSITWFFKTYKD